MKSFSLKPCTREHLKVLRPETYHRFSLREEDPAVTGLCGGKVIFCCGIVIFRPGLGEAWSVVCLEIRDYSGAFREIRRVFEKGIVDYGLHRVESHVRADDVVSVRFNKHLGFRIEGLCRKWGPDGEDYFLMGRVVDG